MYKPLRASLKALWRELRRAGGRHGLLYHERFLVPAFGGPEVLSEEAFVSFQRAYPASSPNEWQSWQRTPDGTTWGRFYGSPDALEEFQRLAESVYLTLREFDPSLPEDHGFHGWLNLLHDMARDYPTPLLRSRHSVWGVANQPTGNEFSEVVDQWTPKVGDEASYPPHPVCNSLVHNVFTSSMAAIELILDSEKALLVGEYLDDFSIGLPSMPRVDRVTLEALPQANKRGVEEALAIPSIQQGAGIPVRAFRKEETVWYTEFAYGGVRESAHVPGGIKGMDLFCYLLDHPNKPFAALELEALAGVPFVLGKSQSYSEEPSDQEGRSKGGGREKPTEALEAINRKIANIQKQIDDTVNEVRKAELEQEIQTLQEVHVKKLLNRSGKLRPSGPMSDQERARKRVNNRLADARRHLARHNMPKLAKYLEETVVGVGATFIFQPGTSLLA